jgi:preprotein translocase subunit SecA
MPQALASVCAEWRSRSSPAPARRPRNPAEAAWGAITGLGLLGRRPGADLVAVGRRAAERMGALEGVSEGELASRLSDLREAFELGRDDRASAIEALAWLGELAARRVGLRPYPEQLAGAAGLIDGRIVEMATGEGKTLVAGLAACAIGWRRRGVHVLTVNDYLAERDAGLCAPLIAGARLDVGVVLGGSDPDARRAAYRCAVTYTTNKEAAADFLRDGIAARGAPGVAGAVALAAMGRPAPASAGPLQRGLAAAIVDEADSILIDEATTPLVLSDRPEVQEAPEVVRLAHAIAGEMRPGRDFEAPGAARRVFLTSRGEALALAHAAWPREIPARRRIELASIALSAARLHERDREYVVEDGRVVIVDESTGRLLPDRTWRAGLHQAIEAKEGVEITPVKATSARLSFQRFFRAYDHLGGMTGTAREVRRELRAVYGRETAAVPTHRPERRRVERARVHRSGAARDAAVARLAAACHAEGRPALVGTRSVSASERLSGLLDELGVPHRVLNAVRHREEAAIVAGAGRAGAVTIATNMAGRGTDIRLDDAARDAGGLVVISAEVNDSPRLDRQLFGRGARQGDPGGARAVVSLEDPVVRRMLPRWALGAAGLVGAGGPAVRAAQWRATRRAGRARRRLMRGEWELEMGLGFAGGG